MKQTPAQLYALLLCLSLFFLPLDYFFTAGKEQYWSVGCAIAQLAFIVLCNKIIKANWIVGIIAIETIGILWNLAVFLRWDDLNDIFYESYDYFSTCSLIIQLLIIAISFRGEHVGTDNSRHTSRARASNILCCDTGVSPNNIKEIAQ